MNLDSIRLMGTIRRFPDRPKRLWRTSSNRSGRREDQPTGRLVCEIRPGLSTEDVEEKSDKRIIQQMSDLTEAQTRLKDEFVRVRGSWNPMWDSVLRAVPEYFEAFLNFSSVPYRRGPLAPKTKELISIAVNAAMTHMYEPAVRAHIPMPCGWVPRGQRYRRS
ncbi:carboxymuconolactone decarboxylase family protein [Limobrevibacterium gyesilva]|uniref:carboxymuconolactone decarboxylase family protein n=1 Tax=Limobrevibacterium gyesilva TaxID=2991712 RepID=UPI0038D1E801